MRRQVEITIKSKDKPDEVYDVTKDFYVENEYDLTTHMNEIAGHIAYYGSLKVEAQQHLKETKASYDVWLAQQKASAYAPSQKSEQAKEEAVIVKDPVEYTKRRNSISDAQYRADMLEVICDAMYAKKDMLISIGAQVRREFGGDMSIKTAEFNRQLENKLP